MCPWSSTKPAAHVRVFAGIIRRPLHDPLLIGGKLRQCAVDPEAAFLASGEEPHRGGSNRIRDYPSVDVRSISTTFAWYAGYGRIGFDSQLWGFEEWRDFLDVCSD